MRRSHAQKREYRLREGDQVPTRPITIREIMASTEFARGVNDARAHRGYPHDFDDWAANDCWSYERGRQWASLAPRGMPLKRNGQITALAMAYYGKHAREIL